MYDTLSLHDLRQIATSEGVRVSKKKYVLVKRLEDKEHQQQLFRNKYKCPLEKYNSSMEVVVFDLCRKKHALVKGVMKGENRVQYRTSRKKKQSFSVDDIHIRFNMTFDNGDCEMWLKEDVRVVVDNLTSEQISFLARNFRCTFVYY
ncbi:unnamed protein product [marine sediment metagenome]|uniref:SAP domain-containing protein n=1 Tax=marine sediment metagenome TaxID=412755 RepID=X1FIE6_9ZZZZ